MRIVLTLALLLFSAGLARGADCTTHIVQNTPRGSMDYNYRSGPGNTWAKTTTYTMRTPRGTVVETYHFEDGNKWSKNSTITTNTPRGTMVQTFNSGSDSK